MVGLSCSRVFPEGLFFPNLLFPLDSFLPIYDTSHRGAGAPLPLAAAVKQAVSVPVITVADLIMSWEEKILREGKADSIALTGV